MTTPAKLITPTRTSIGNEILICRAGTDIQGTKVGKNFKPTAESGEYQSIGYCIDFQFQSDTEDDPVTYYDPATDSWETDKGTIVTSDNIIFNMAEVSQVFWDIILRPGSEMISGKESTPFVRERPGLECWLKATKKDRSGNEIMILEVYGRLTAESPTESNKLTKPQYKLEVIKSTLNEVTPSSGVGYEETTP